MGGTCSIYVEEVKN